MPALTPSTITANAAGPTGVLTKHLIPATIQARAIVPTPHVTVQRANRPDNPTLTSTFIMGDWLIQAPSIALKFSLDYQESDESWDHRILDISPIEMSVPPGGGIATVGNVTIKVAEDRARQSILQLMDYYPTINGAPITIDFLVRGVSALPTGVSNPLRVFTGKIDTIAMQNAVADILCVDTSLQQNLRLPQTLVASAAFSQAVSVVYGQPEPLVYGAGSNIGAAPLLFTDIPTNTYLIAGHPMYLGSGNIAVFDQANTLFLAASGVQTFTNDASGAITFGLFNQGVLSWGSAVGVTNGLNIVDGNSTTLTLVNTGTLDSNAIDGYGQIGVFETTPGTPTTDILQIMLINHRRSPGSDPTVNGTFYIQTVSPTTGNLLRTLQTTEAYRHVTSAQTDVFTLEGTHIAQNEQLEVKLIVRNDGALGTASQTYEIGEVHVAGVVVFPAVSAGLTTMTLPINTQEIRFNSLSYTLSIDTDNTDTFVMSPANAIDLLSRPPAIIPTCALDSNLDGVGQLTVITPLTSNQLGNNTLSIDFTNHRRQISSTPTVTGTFFVQTARQTTDSILRDNLFVSPPYRQALNPLSTSFTATAINLGANMQVAVRVLARNEGGIGSYTAALSGTSVTSLVSTVSYSVTWGGTISTGPGDFAQPTYIARDSTSSIFVVDQLNTRVQQFTSTGTFVSQFGTSGYGGGQFLTPVGIAIDAADKKYVVDLAKANVQVFDAANVFVAQWGTYGAATGQFLSPWDIAAAPDGTLWVTDTALNVVQQFTSAGTYRATIGGTGSSDGLFESPIGVAVDTGGTVWVTDQSPRVQAFTNSGAFLRSFGAGGAGQGQFNNPLGITTGISGSVWVADAVNNTVQRFTSAGSYLLTFGGGGAGFGQFNGPFGLVAGASSLLWVVDANNTRVQQFLVSWTSTTTVLTSGANDAYEIGEIGIRSFYQPAGGNMPVFLYGASWFGRFDDTGTILSYAGLPSGTFFNTPDQVIASVLIQELGHSVTASAFANAYTWYTNLGFTLDGGVGAGWAVQRDQARKILGDMALQAAAILSPNFDESFRLLPFQASAPIHLAFGVSNILMADGDEKKVTGPYQDTMQITLGNLQLVHNSFELHYAYNAGSRTYGKIMTVDKTGSTLVTDAQYKILIESLCLQSFNRFGDLPPLVLDAYWIADDFSAQYLMAFLVQYFSGQRTFVEFDTTLYAASLQVGDFITVTHPLLPTNDNGGTYEVHTVRYLPMQGRMHLIASKVTTLSTPIRPPAILAHAVVPDPIVRLTAPNTASWAEPWEYLNLSATLLFNTTNWSNISGGASRGVDDYTSFTTAGWSNYPGAADAFLHFDALAGTPPRSTQLIRKDQSGSVRGGIVFTNTGVPDTNFDGGITFLQSQRLIGSAGSFYFAGWHGGNFRVAFYNSGNNTGADIRQIFAVAASVGQQALVYWDANPSGLGGTRITAYLSGVLVCDLLDTFHLGRSYSSGESIFYTEGAGETAAGMQTLAYGQYSVSAASA